MGDKLPSSAAPQGLVTWTTPVDDPCYWYSHVSIRPEHPPNLATTRRQVFWTDTCLLSSLLIPTTTVFGKTATLVPINGHNLLQIFVTNVHTVLSTATRLQITKHQSTTNNLGTH